MLTVATESLAVLAATLAVADHVGWLLSAALCPFALSLGFYVFVMARYDLRQLATGHGDHWITGGALALSTLAAGKLAIGVRALAMTGNGGGALKGLTVALWLLTMAWLPVLLFAEARYPRLHYDVRRWSTVFPVGMYAACSFVVGGRLAQRGGRELRPSLGVDRRRRLGHRLCGHGQARDRRCPCRAPARRH
jgi:hypothetical protein